MYIRRKEDNVYIKVDRKQGGRKEWPQAPTKATFRVMIPMKPYCLELSRTSPNHTANFDTVCRGHFLFHSSRWYWRDGRRHIMTSYPLGEFIGLSLKVSLG